MAMPEFLVRAVMTFPPQMPLDERRRLLAAESAAAEPYIRDGSFRRVWRTRGTHEGNHDHLALWSVSPEVNLYRIYAGFPLSGAGILQLESVTQLQHNPNDPGPGGWHAPAPDAPFPLTYYNMRKYLDSEGEASGISGEGRTAWLAPEVTIHDHPASGRSREIHFMVSGQKIAEIGPLTPHAGDEVGPAYIDLLAEWAGKPVHHDQWKNLILADNGLLHDNYESAVRGPRRGRLAAS